MPLNGGPAKYLQPATLLVPEIRELLGRQDYATLKPCLRELHPADLADSWGAFEPEEQVQLFRLLSITASVKLFECLPMDAQRFLLMTLGDESGPVIEGLSATNVARIFHRLPAKVVKKLVGLVRREESLQQIQLLMTFPQGTAGSLMHPEFIKLTPQMTAKQALETLQAVARPHQGRHRYALYVTNGQGRLQGALTIQDLLSAPSDARLGEFMGSVEAIKIPAPMDQEEVAKRFAKYNLVDAPVVDDENRLIGILTVDDIIDVMRQEASEDIAKMAGTRAGLLTRPLWYITTARFPWLIATCLGYFLVGWVVKHYEGTLAQVIGLASFMPLIAAMGGNVGAQTATAVVRGMATGEIKSMTIMEVVAKEALVGILLGVLYGVGAGTIAHLIYGERFGLRFAYVIGTGMFASMSAASIMGSLEPFIFQRLGIDPATATGPLITFFADLVSTATYLTIATWLFLM